MSAPIPRLTVDPPKTYIAITSNNMDNTGSNSTTVYAPWVSTHGNSPKSSKKEALSPDMPKSYNFINGGKEVLFGGPLNLLLTCVPIGMMSYYLNWSSGVTFAFALLAIAPLAERLGFCTEQLAIHTNDSIGGLLNATFGNATEVIVGITALSKGLYRVVQLSLLGSVLSNLLLVLGCAFFFGGLKFKTQSFGKITSQISAGILILATMCLVFPAILTQTNIETKGAEINFSRGVSVILLLTYGAFIYFQVRLFLLRKSNGLSILCYSPQLQIFTFYFFGH
jgi:Ca2+:H+ antiporter